MERLATVLTDSCCLTPSVWHAWADLTGTWAQQSSVKQQFGFHDSNGSLSFGIDGTYDDVSLGLFGAYQMDHVKWAHNAGEATMRATYGGGYAMIYGSHYLVDLSFLVGYTNYNVERKIQIASLRRTAFARYNSCEGVAGIGVGSYNTLCGVEWVPYARVDYAYVAQKAFSESHANSLNLHVRPCNSSLVQFETGIFFEHTCDYEFKCFNGLLNSKLNLSYLGQYNIHSKHLETNFINNPNCLFSAQGWGMGRNLFSPTFSFTFFPAGLRLSFEIGYTGQFGRHYWSQQGYIGVDWKF